MGLVLLIIETFTDKLGCLIRQVISTIFFRQQNTKRTPTTETPLNPHKTHFTSY